MNYKNLLLLIILLLPVSALAFIDDPNPNIYLVGIPGIKGTSLSFDTYINALYALAISVGALVAVLKIIIAGMKYMLSEVVTSKTDAIKDIQNSLFGLIIVVSAYLILNTINPNLLRTELITTTLDNTNKPNATEGGSPSGSPENKGTSGGSPTGASSQGYRKPDVIPCTKPVGVARASFNCSEATKQCSDVNKGTPKTSHDGSVVTCSYGTEVFTASCTTPGSANVRMTQCSTLTTRCSSQGGKGHTEPDGNIIKFICYKP